MSCNPITNFSSYCFSLEKEKKIAWITSFVVGILAVALSASLSGFFQTVTCYSCLGATLFVFTGMVLAIFFLSRRGKENRVLYPDKKDLQDQLNPPGFTPTQLLSSTLQKEVTLWADAVVDLKRCNFTLNGHRLSQLSNEQIFDHILVACNSNENAAISLTALLNQRFTSTARMHVMKDKKMVDEQDQLFYNFQNGQDYSARLNTFGDDFVLSLSLTLPKFKHADVLPDPIVYTYVKMKTIISGKLTDLGEKNIAKLTYQVHYSKEYQNAKEASDAKI